MLSVMPQIPGACLVRVRELGCPVLLGNHDEAACLAEPPVEFNQTAKAGALFSSRNLMDSEKEWLRSLPQQLEIGDVAFTHASLESTC